MDQRALAILCAIIAFAGECVLVSGFASPSSVLRWTKVRSTCNRPVHMSSKGAKVVTEFYANWNDRKIAQAADLFTSDCEYNDTQFGVLKGKRNIRAHFRRAAEALPKSCKFCIDELADGGTRVGVQWHLEVGGSELPFTRGCSMYVIDKTGLIAKGFDVVQPVIPPGAASLTVLTIVSKFSADPVRLIPFSAWLLYCWGLFLSDVLPGVNALALDPSTWSLVRNLSLNFWLVFPTLDASHAPVVHPMLEGVFNIVLCWAALFVGFLSDGQVSKVDDEDNEDEGLPFLPYVIVMQFLTNAALLPYLFIRPHSSSRVFEEDLTLPEKIGENRAVPITLAAVCVMAIVWSFIGRPEFGDIPERLTSFLTIVETQRLPFSFLVDMLYFWVFQSWLVRDDMARRGEPQGLVPAAMAAVRFIPFFGLAGYLLLRPRLPRRK